MGKVPPAPPRSRAPGTPEHKPDPQDRDKPRDDRLHDLLHPLNPASPLSIL